ncbi:Chromosome partition protein Smc [Bacillus sp. THAF10]|uniref:hypothetical protein n=1 Tax=Bacillus sp. THAF10 TaxID=2587848 RepID=UPI001268FF2D|nr:hypothetical protein [Bacillus sp. THAF10]QFT87576.1 Chromosome partition protein Smc [Bacillus sp. THAF10]
MKPFSSYSKHSMFEKNKNKKSHLASLRKKALAAQTTQTEATETTSPKTAKPSLKPWKEKVKKLTQKAHLQEEKWQKEKKEHLNTKKTLKTARDKLHHTQNKLENQHKTIQHLEKKLAKALERLEDLQKQNEQLQEKNLQLETSLLKYKNSATTYKGMIKPLQKKMKELTFKNEMYQKEQEKWNRMQERRYQQENKIKATNREQAKQLEKWHNLSPELLLQHLYESMSLKNHQQYFDTISLHRKFRWMQSTIKRHNARYIKDKQPIFGALTKKEDGWWLKGPSGEYWKITSHPPIHLKEGTPVLASQIGNRVEVITIYQDEIEQKRDSIKIEKERESTRGRNNNHSSPEFVQKFPPHAYNWSVLLVTSDNGSRYQQFLSEQGFQVDWIDPYEKSAIHVHQQMAAHDLVLLDLGHIPHVVTNLVPQDETWVQRFQTFRKKTLLARILYLAANCSHPREMG